MRKGVIFILTCLLVLGAAGVVFAQGTVSAKAVSSTKIELRWNLIPEASKYVISRGMSPDGEFQNRASVSGTTTSYRDNGITPGKTYYYKVTPISGSTGKEMPEAEMTIKGKTPKTVQIKKINVKSDTRLKLYWDAGSGANGYQVYRSTSEDGNYQLITTINGKSTTSYTDASVVPGKIYYYKLRATNSVNGTTGNSSYSEVVRGRTVASPKITSISSNGSSSMKLNWKRVSGASSYEIYRSTSASKGFKKIATVKGSSKSYTDKKITSGKKYYYKLVTVSSLDGKKITSSYTKEISCRSLKKVKISSVKTTTEEGLKVKWSKISGASTYKVYRATSERGTYKRIATVKATSSSSQSYTDKKVSSGKTYYYKVQAYSADNGVIAAGSGSKSDVKKGSTLYSIMGKTSVTVDQMVALYESTGRKYPSSVYKDKGAKNIKQFCQIILEESEKEGVKAEVIFAQVCLETGYLSFGGQVSAGQCNFSGIGATDDGASGATFPNVRIGIRAQVQHLKGYASKEALKQDCVDPRFKYLASRRGTTPYVQNLGNGNWATDPLYSIKLMNLIKSMKSR